MYRPLIAAALLCLSAAPLTAQERPAPLKMALITASAQPDVADALDRVLAASPLIARVEAQAPPADGDVAARAAWLRASGLEGAVLVAQQGDQLTLTTIGPAGEVLGESRASAAAVAGDAWVAQAALQRAAGLLGPAVLKHRAAQAQPPQAAAEPVKPVNPVKPAPEPVVARPAARPAPWDGDGLRVALGARYAPSYLARATTPNMFGAPGDATDEREATLIGMSVQLGPSRASSAGADSSPFWMDITLDATFEELPVITSHMLFGAVFASFDTLHLDLGAGMRFHYVGMGGFGSDLMIIQVDLLGAGLRWYTPLDGLVARVFASGGLAPAPQPGAFGVSLSAQAELRYLIGALLFVEGSGLYSAGILSATPDRSASFSWRSVALGLGVQL